MCANCICYKFATMPFGLSWYLHKPTIKSQQHYSVTLGPNYFRFVVEKMHIVRSVSAQLTTVFIREACYIHCIAVKNLPLLPPATYFVYDCDITAMVSVSDAVVGRL